jgi:hypothetical protein
MAMDLQSAVLNSLAVVYRRIFKKRSSSCAALVSVVIVFCTPAAYAQEESRPDLEGFYLGTLILQEDPRWLVEDFICSICTSTAFEYTQALLRDPQNDDRSILELREDVILYAREYVSSLTTVAAREFASGYDLKDNPVIQCEPPGLLRQITAPLPFQIEQHNDRVILRHEWFNTERTVYMDGRDHPQGLSPSRLGHSVGWYDGSTLVVETTGITSRIYAPFAFDGLRNSSQARLIERYTLTEGGRLVLEWTVVDPRTLRRPLTYLRTRLLVPDLEMIEEKCEAVSGEY